MITVPTKKILDVLPNTPLDKEYALVESEKKIYQYITEKESWEPVKIEGDGLQVSLYDINKNIFAQLDPLTDDGLRQAHSTVYKFLGESMKDEVNDYWALMCWERQYITIFHHSKFGEEELSDVFMEIIENLGDVKDVYDNGNGALEVWITNEIDTYCYLFFNYKVGVVEGIA